MGGRKKVVSHHLSFVRLGDKYFVTYFVVGLLSLVESESNSGQCSAVKERKWRKSGMRRIANNYDVLAQIYFCKKLTSLPII